jgi:hypothetical protein
MQIINVTAPEPSKTIREWPYSGLDIGLPHMSLAGPALPPEAFKLGWRYVIPLPPDVKRTASRWEDNGKEYVEVETAKFTDAEYAAVQDARAEQDARAAAAAEVSRKASDVAYLTQHPIVMVAIGLVNSKADKPLTAEEVDAVVRGVVDA